MTRPTLAASATAAAMLAMAACSAPQPQSDTNHWSAVIEWQDGSSDIVEHGVTLPDCMNALEAYDTNPRAAVTWCETVTESQP